MAKFLVVGDATVDQMYFVDALPEPGGEVTATRALMKPGGAGGTVAMALASLGNEVRVATRVGHGPFADLALSNMEAVGVNMELVQRDAERQTSSVTLLVTPDTQRTMISALAPRARTAGSGSGGPSGPLWPGRPAEAKASAC